MSFPNMKKQSKRAAAKDTMRAEYDFSNGVRGKHAARYAAGTNVVILAPDVARQFRSSEEVNEALRAIVKLLERRKHRNGRKSA